MTACSELAVPKRLLNLCRTICEEDRLCNCVLAVTCHQHDISFCCTLFQFGCKGVSPGVQFHIHIVGCKIVNHCVFCISSGKIELDLRRLCIIRNSDYRSRLKLDTESLVHPDAELITSYKGEINKTCFLIMFYSCEQDIGNIGCKNRLSVKPEKRLAFSSPITVLIDGDSRRSTTDKKPLAIGISERAPCSAIVGCNFPIEFSVNCLSTNERSVNDIVIHSQLNSMSITTVVHVSDHIVSFIVGVEIGDERTVLDACKVVDLALQVCNRLFISREFCLNLCYLLTHLRVVVARASEEESRNDCYYI